MSAADPTKRALMTIGDSSEVLKKSDKSAGSASGKSKTLRFDLELFEPDEYKFPEFNYKKLVHIEKVNWTKIFFFFARLREKKKEKRIHIFSIYIVSPCFCFVELHCIWRVEFAHIIRAEHGGCHTKELKVRRWI